MADDDAYLEAQRERDTASIKGFMLNKAKETASADHNLLMSDNKCRLSYQGSISSTSYPVLVLLHGIGGSHASWRDVIPRVSPFLNVISVSLRGWGDSIDNSKAVISISQYAEDVKELLSNLNPPKNVVVMGYEMGAAVAVQLANIDPRVTILSLIDSNVKGMRDADKTFSSWGKVVNESELTNFLGLDFLVSQKKISRAFGETLLANACLSTPENYVSSWKSFSSYNIAENVKKLKIPILWLWSEDGLKDDKLYKVAPSSVRAFLDEVKVNEGSSVAYIPTLHGASNSPLSCAAEIKTLLSDFLIAKSLISNKWATPKIDTKHDPKSSTNKKHSVGEEGKEHGMLSPSRIKKHSVGEEGKEHAGYSKSHK